MIFKSTLFFFLPLLWTAKVSKTPDQDTTRGASFWVINNLRPIGVEGYRSSSAQALELLPNSYLLIPNRNGLLGHGML